jgi:DNA-binding response OmpR family regulator
MARYWTPDAAVVLIAENDDIVADLLTLVVEQAGATPLVTYDGLHALSLARERRPALLITESILSGLSGAELIAALHRERGAALPSILVTSAPKALTGASGASAILPKPFHIATLEVLLARLLAPQPPMYVPVIPPWMPAPAAAGCSGTGNLR